MGAHARFSPSSAHRRIECPPSLILEEQFDDEESIYAAEGSAGHELAEHLIKKYLKLRSRRPTSEWYTDELIDAVNSYVSFVSEEIEEARKAYRNPIFMVEHRVDASEFVDECFGTADMVIISDKMVHIIDLKLGKGVEVSAEENPQLMIYGLGVLSMAELLFDIKTIKMTIFQPRLYSVSSWDVTPEKLNTWGEETLKPRGAMALMGAGEFSAGSWCRFCKARKQCRKRAESYLEMAKMEFQEPALLSDEEIAEVLKVADQLSKWATDIYTYAQDEAIRNGKKFQGFKLVEGRSNRKYSSEEEAERAAKKAGYEDIYKKTLISITEMEKLMGKNEFKKVIGPLVYKPQGKLAFVPDSDKREEINNTSAQAEFQEEE